MFSGLLVVVSFATSKLIRVRERPEGNTTVGSEGRCHAHHPRDFFLQPQYSDTFLQTVPISCAGKPTAVSEIRELQKFDYSFCRLPLQKQIETISIQGLST
jgi:hypothetical protein